MFGPFTGGYSLKIDCFKPEREKEREIYESIMFESGCVGFALDVCNQLIEIMDTIGHDSSLYR